MNEQTKNNSVVDLDTIRKLSLAIHTEEEFCNISLIPLVKGDIRLMFLYWCAATDIFEEEFAEHATNAAQEIIDGIDNDGSVCLIAKVNYPVTSATDIEIVGVTGFFFVNEYIGNRVNQHAVLRWHGVIPKFRSKGYSQTALTLIQKYIRENHSAKYLHEVSETSNPVQYFTKLGFVEKHPGIDSDFRDTLRNEAGCYGAVLTLPIETDIFKNMQAVAKHEDDWRTLLGVDKPPETNLNQLQQIAAAVTTAEVKKFPDLHGNQVEAPDFIVSTERYQKMQMEADLKLENLFRTSYNLPTINPGADLSTLHMYTEDGQLLLDIVNIFNEHISYGGVTFGADLRREVFRFAIKQRCTEVGNKLAEILKIPANLKEAIGPIMDRYVVIFYPEYEPSGGRCDFRVSFKYLVDAVKYAIEKSQEDPCDFSDISIYDRFADKLYYLN